MKKKILIILLIPIILIGLSGCGKTNNNEKKDSDKKLVLADKKLGLKTTFNYNDKTNITDIEYDTDGASKELTFVMEDQDAEIQMYYTSMSDNMYNTTQETRSKQKYYKEYKFGKYKAYAYSEYGSTVKLSILLKANENKMYDILFVDMQRLDTDESIIMAEVLEKEELQELFKSMTFKKTNKQQ